MENYGINQREWLLQVTTDSGLTGLSNARPAMNAGSLNALHDVLKDLIGQRLSDFFTVSGGRVTNANPRWSALIGRFGFIDVALFDLMGQALGQPSHSLLGERVRDSVESYDSTLYFQDLVNPLEGANAVAREAAEAVEKGWRAVKLKLGRPGKWFEPNAGTRRDIEVVELVRETVGPKIKILVDANNGYDGQPDLLEDLRRRAAWGVLGAPPVPVLHADAEVELEDLTTATWHFVSSMGPFGEANREPILVTFGAVPLDVRTVGVGGKHLRISFDAEGRRIESIGFGLGDRPLGPGPVDIMYQLRSEVWRGRTRHQLGLRDIRPSKN